MSGRKLKPGEVLHARIRSDNRDLSLIAFATPDGWLSGIYEIGASEPLDGLSVWSDPGSAVAQLEWYARHRLRATVPIEWSSDPL